MDGSDVNTTFPYQRDLFVQQSVRAPEHARFNGRSGAFGDNMSLPVHRWYRYSAGFSADWVRRLVRERRAETGTYAVLDPFAGVGTTLLACAAEGVRSWGFETHPFVHRIACAKLRGIHADVSAVRETFARFVNALSATPHDPPETVPSLLAKCYTRDTLAKLLAMRDLYLEEFHAETPETELLWLILTSILRDCSGAGTAQWQYVLPNKKKAGVQRPKVAFHAKAVEMLQDIEHAQRNGWSSTAIALPTDARAPRPLPRMQADAVITSPPYPNNYDYADATRLEMTFWNEIRGWGDLQGAVRGRPYVSSSATRRRTECISTSIPGWENWPSPRASNLSPPRKFGSATSNGRTESTASPSK